MKVYQVSFHLKVCQVSFYLKVYEVSSPKLAMPQNVLSKESFEYLSNAQPKLLQSIDGRSILSVSSYSSHSTDPQNTIDIPEYIESYETLLFCGLVPRAAEIIWKAYQSRVEILGEICADFAETIENFIKSDSNVDALREWYDWKGVLIALGANDYVIERVLNLPPKAVMPGETATDWMWLVVYERLDFLGYLDESVKVCEEQKQNQGQNQSRDCDESSLAPLSHGSGRKRSAEEDGGDRKRRH